MAGGINVPVVFVTSMKALSVASLPPSARSHFIDWEDRGHMNAVTADTVSVARRVVALAACLFVAGMSLWAGAANAAVPVFPDNIVVFPNRDFVTVEGFQNHVGDTALVEVTRAGVGVVGSAEAVVQQGDVAFEINHPGGACWGAGTGLKVTPDIQPGDVVSINFGGGPVEADVVTQDAYVTGVTYTNNAASFTVEGHIDPGVDRANVEQRIVNPDLTGTAVGRRDIRALPGPPAADRSGQFESGIEFVAPDRFVATYVFNDPAVARIAATGGGERFMSWQFTDADANRQGITIAELGELGGPGMGGCPNGPLGSGPPGPSGVTAARVTVGGNPAIRVDWTPAVALPGTPPVTGYRVHAVSQNAVDGQQVEIGRRITGQAVAGTTITGVNANEEYDVFVVSVSSVGETYPAVHALAAADVTRPVLSASPTGSVFATAQNVTVSSSEPNTQIFFTTNGNEPLVNGQLSNAAGVTHYTGPITIAADTVLKAVGFDPSGNVSDVLVRTFTINPNGVAPGTPTITSTSVGLGSVTLTWSPDGTMGAATDYRIGVRDANGPVGTPVTVPATATTYTATGLAEVPHFFTVTAINPLGESSPAQAGPLTPLGPVVANAGADLTVTRSLNNAAVTLDGTTSTGVGATYKWEQIAPAVDADRVTLIGDTTPQPTFTLPLFAFPMTNAPRTFRLTVTSADRTVVKTDEVTVNVRAGDTIAVTAATWKAGDFRVSGTGSLNGARIAIYSGARGNVAPGRLLGTVTVTAGAWTLRLRNGAAPATRPSGLWIDSNVGSMLGPITVN